MAKSKASLKVVDPKPAVELPSDPIGDAMLAFGHARAIIDVLTELTEGLTIPIGRGDSLSCLLYSALGEIDRGNALLENAPRDAGVSNG